MHIVRFQGGLGNQMFQYALYNRFQSIGYDTYADLYSYSQTKFKERDFQLSVFGIDVRQADIEDIIHLAANERCYLDVLRLKYFGKKTYIKEHELNKFNSQLFEIQEGYFSGYWQSEKYFKEIKNEIRDKFFFRKDIVGVYGNNEIEQMIMEDKNAVSIHVRLGDYLTNTKLYGGICTTQYYQRAISYIKGKVSKPTFFLFSDDIELAKSYFRDDKITYVDNNPEIPGYIDMYLMSLCKHHIIANSSFSWWGAWLGQKEDSIIIAPEKWLRDMLSLDIVPSDWVKL